MDDRSTENILDPTAQPSATQLNNNYGFQNSNENSDSVLNPGSTVKNSQQGASSSSKRDVRESTSNSDIQVTNTTKSSHQISSRVRMLMGSNMLVNTARSNKTSLKTLCRFVISFHRHSFSDTAPKLIDYSENNFLKIA